MQSVPVSDANFTARDKRQLANAPYQRAFISPAYQRQIVPYHRKETPGSILVDTAGRYVFFVLPGARRFATAQPWARMVSPVRRGHSRPQGGMAGMDADRG